MKTATVILFLSCGILVFGRGAAMQLSEVQGQGAEIVSAAPANPVDLLKAIKRSYDEDIFFRDESFSPHFVSALFGGMAQIKYGGYYRLSASIENGQLVDCGHGGLCAESIRFQKGVREDGTEFVTLQSKFLPSQKLSRLDISELLKNQGKRVLEIPSPHRVIQPPSITGGNDLVEYEAVSGKYLVRYNEDASVGEITYIKEK